MIEAVDARTACARITLIERAHPDGRITLFDGEPTPDLRALLADRPPLPEGAEDDPHLRAIATVIGAHAPAPFTPCLVQGWLIYVRQDVLPA